MTKEQLLLSMLLEGWNWEYDNNSRTYSISKNNFKYILFHDFSIDHLLSAIKGLAYYEGKNEKN